MTRGGSSIFSGIESQSADQVGYQIGLLGERGLVKVVDTRTDDEPNSWSAIRLTALGHEFLREQRASRSIHTATKEEGNSPMANSGGRPDLTPTRFQRWKRAAEEHPVTATMLLAFVVLVAFAGGWKQITGDHLWTSIKDALTNDGETLEECRNSAKTPLEIDKCYVQ
jgi:hypothetical protein